MKQQTQREKMLAGKLYDPSDPEISTMLSRAHQLCKDYNLCKETEQEQRESILRELLPHTGVGTYLAGPIFFDYGEFTTLGDHVYANFNFTVLDVCPVAIGDNVMFGPNVSLLTPLHPLRWQERNIRQHQDGSEFDYEYGAPITIGSNCWIAGNVTVTGGVTIGAGSVIGAAAVVTHDIPENVLAAGVPCKVIREIGENDRMDLPALLH
ncbi:MAG: sugar O-acetyltransferase [Bifidobacterium sp.]|jgi:maltose O-acetyltransferase|nr:sugar O-acetyltransferase [Bifidobacterium sp.]MCH4174264.1 sugar O-acetyltransferase [Bifidobacterium sp.]